MSYLNSVTIIGFVGADPEQRQARNNNGRKFPELSLILEQAVATQRSWKNTDDEWASKTEWHRVCVFRPRLAEYTLSNRRRFFPTCPLPKLPRSVGQESCPSEWWLDP
ncbi:MAG TPA: single-stranded DNA-binding protein [Candidatus Acidoferrum sp.]|nr:single-stranded DNA-binding protein [Candidatus Acidoferrum sp.]